MVIDDSIKQKKTKGKIMTKKLTIEELNKKINKLWLYYDILNIEPYKEDKIYLGRLESLKRKLLKKDAVNV